MATFSAQIPRIFSRIDHGQKRFAGFFLAWQLNFFGLKAIIEPTVRVHRQRSRRPDVPQPHGIEDKHSCYGSTASGGGPEVGKM